MSQLVLWVDLETTGLRADLYKILEVGAKVTNEKLETVDIFHKIAHYKLDYIDSLMEPIVKEMHTKSGLLAEVERSEVRFSVISSEFDAFVAHYFPEGRALVAGSSVHFDIDGINYHMPDTARRLHYRRIDVSAIMEAHRIFKGRVIPKVESKHRSLPDIDDSINLMKQLLEL